MFSNEELEKMGREMASKLEHDGMSIMRAFSEALTDSNYHHEAEVVEKMIAANEATDGNVAFELVAKPR